MAYIESRMIYRGSGDWPQCRPVDVNAPEFAVGDRIQCTCAACELASNKGLGVVVSLGNDKDLNVRFDGEQRTAMVALAYAKKVKEGTSPTEIVAPIPVDLTGKQLNSVADIRWAPATAGTCQKCKCSKHLDYRMLCYDCFKMPKPLSSVSIDVLTAIEVCLPSITREGKSAGVDPATLLPADFIKSYTHLTGKPK